MQDYFELTCSKPIVITLEVEMRYFGIYNGRRGTAIIVCVHVCVCVCVENIIGRQLVKMELFSKKVVIYKLAWGQVTSLFPLQFPLGQNSSPPNHHFHLKKHGLVLRF